MLYFCLINHNIPWTSLVQVENEAYQTYPNLKPIADIAYIVNGNSVHIAMMVPPPDRENDDHSDERVSEHPRLYMAVARYPYLFLSTLPLLFIVLIAVGLSRPVLVEEDIASLWIPSDGSYARDKKYAKEVGATDTYSTFAAMALGRHGDNLFTEDNLHAIVERMQRIENIQVS